MTIRVKFFAILRDRAGRAECTLDLPAGATVTDARVRLATEFPEIGSDLARSAIAVNRAYRKPDHALADGDELALIPPVSGG